MKQKNTLLRTALGLLMSAISAQAADIVISAVPYNITQPGTYVLASNVVFTAGYGNAVTINVAKAGSVVLNLKGFTINSTGVYGGTGIGISNPTGSNITVENGTIQGEFGLRAINSNNVHITRIIFEANGVSFDSVSSSSISDCVFAGGSDCIIDQGTTSGNSYTNNSFKGSPSVILAVQFSTAPLVLEHCDFEPLSNSMFHSPK